MLKLEKYDSTPIIGKPKFRLTGDFATSLSLQTIRTLLLERNEDYFGLPISVEVGQISFPGSGLFSKGIVTDCIIVTNTAHAKKYAKQCITLTKQGKAAAIVEITHFGRCLAYERGTKFLSAMVGSGLADDDAAKEYYAAIYKVLSEVLPGAELI